MTTQDRHTSPKSRAIPPRVIALLAALACLLPLGTQPAWAQVGVSANALTSTPANTLSQASSPAHPPAASMPVPMAAPQLAAEKPNELNDSGAALTPPDLSLYEGQLAAMQKLQRDNLELKLELQQAELKAQIRASEHPGAKDEQESQASPSVVNLTGIGGTRQALITVPGYGQVTVRAGDTLPNHWKVAAIDDGGVVVTIAAGRHAQRVRLPFHTDAAVPRSPA